MSIHGVGVDRLQIKWNHECHDLFFNDIHAIECLCVICSIMNIDWSLI